jgi:hypothetical protein
MGENIKRIVTRTAGTNVTNMRFLVEVPGADPLLGAVVNRAGAGVPPDGVCAMVSYGFLGTTIDAGDEVPFATDGDILMEAGGVIPEGSEVMSDSVGRAVLFVPDGVSVSAGKLTNGTSAGAAGDIVCVTFYKKAQHAGAEIS